MTGRGMMGDGAVLGSDERALMIGLATVSTGAGLCEWGTIKTTTNVRAKPAVGNATQPAHPAAGMMRLRICRSRDLAWGSDTGGGSPCHSHKPASLLSVLIKTASAEGDIGASSFMATVSPYAGPIDPLCSACIATIPSQLQHHPLFSPSAPLDGINAAPVSKLARLVVARLTRRETILASK
jgi:hypothetical protein